MTNPTYDFTRGSAAEATNPLHLIRIDHLQLTGSIEKLEPLYRRLGFARVASQQAPLGTSNPSSPRTHGYFDFRGQ